MRKHARSKALPAVLFLSLNFLAADVVISPVAASARTLRNRSRVRVRPAARPRPAVRPQAPVTPENLAALRFCESGDDYTRTGGRYFGAYQFSPRTWSSLGYEGMPHEAEPEVQDEAAAALQARSGWGQWPACSRKLGFR